MNQAWQRFKKDWQGKRVVIMGLGLQGGGVDAANCFAEIGCQVTITDLKPASELEPSLRRLKKGFPFRLVLGRHRKKEFANCDLIIKNPAVRPDSPYLQLARKKGVPIKMSTSLFASYCPAKMIGVTGTRGKSTTTALIFEVLKKTGQPVWLGGNVPEAATLSLLKKVAADHWVVLELSSWELWGFHQEKLSPPVAVFTNVYPDHLNYYSSLADYVKDKTAIFRYQSKDDLLVINRDSAETRRLAATAPSQVVWFGRSDWPASWPLKLKGEHNRENAAAAFKTVTVLGVRKDLAYKVIARFGGLPYRLEPVGRVRGVEFINDTTSTTPTATEKALETLQKPLVLIAGGADKNLPLASLAKRIAQEKKVKRVVLLKGTATPKLEKLIRRYGGGPKLMGRFDELKRAVLAAYSAAAAGEVVLLSPGCASFGMFKNEFDRGEQFNQVVTDLEKKLND